MVLRLCLLELISERTCRRSAENLPRNRLVMPVIPSRVMYLRFGEEDASELREVQTGAGSRRASKQKSKARCENAQRNRGHCTLASGPSISRILTIQRMSGANSAVHVSPAPYCVHAGGASAQEGQNQSPSASVLSEVSSAFEG